MDQTSKQENEIESLELQAQGRIDELDANLELIAIDRPSADTLRLYIDHPDGVTLEHCEIVTAKLRDLLADYGLEVSSPGLDRPLTKPSHFERFVGREVRVRTAEPINGRRNFTGRLAAAGPDAISVDSGEGEIEIPLGLVRRSNLVPQLSEVHQ